MSFKTGNNKHILIIGGMGPQASVYAHTLLLKEATEAGADSNESYPRITHLSINVHDFISQPTYRDHAKEYILKCLSEIDLTTVDAAFIACNTAHILAEDITAATNLPLISLIEETQQYLITEKNVRKVGLLATPSTINTGLYQEVLGEGSALLVPDLDASNRIESIIRDVIAGRSDEQVQNLLQAEVDSLKARGADRVILGCTELSLLGSYIDDPVLVDPLILVAKKAICLKV